MRFKKADIIEKAKLILPHPSTIEQEYHSVMVEMPSAYHAKMFFKVEFYKFFDFETTSGSPKWCFFNLE